MQSENLLRSECGGYESDDSGGGRGAPPGPPGYYPPPQHQYQVFIGCIAANDDGIFAIKSNRAGMEIENHYIRLFQKHGQY